MLIEHILRDGDAVERVLGVVAAVDRDRGPAQTAIVGARHCREHMRADRLVRIADRNRGIEACPKAAPHIKPLRRAADEDRDRLERELCLVCRLGGLTFSASAAAASCAVLAASSLVFASAFAVSSWVASSAARAAAFCFRSSARALASSVLAAASTFSAKASAASARVLSASSLRSDAGNGAAARAAMVAAPFAWSANLAASAASRASVSARAGASARPSHSARTAPDRKT